MSGIASFLDSFVGKPEDIDGLALALVSVTESTSGFIFVKRRNTISGRGGRAHRLSLPDTTHLDTSVNHVLVGEFPIAGRASSFHSPGSITGIHICNTGNDLLSFRTEQVVHSLLVIPIMSDTERLGTVCLVNCPNGYDDETVRKLSPYVSISQLMLGKQQMMLEYKRLCDDSSYNSKDLFLANMSHEIRTPLNGVIGYGQLLIGTDMSSTQKGYVNNMNQCSIQLMRIINDVLDFSKLSTGKMKLNNECFPMRDVARAVVGAMGQRIKEKRQSYSFLVDDSVPEFLVIDKHKFIQIIVNLVSNASKFTDIGGLISVLIRQDSPSVLTVSVEDNGIGVSDTDQCKLFNTFMQIESSTYKTGTGLGLAISKKLTELLGGVISIKSILGGGSVFTFTAVYEPVEEFTKTIKANADLLKGKTVLVVDDNADNRIVVSEMLEEWEMHPVAVGTALEALRLIMGKRYDFAVALIDICMPGTSGTELAKQIKEELPYFPLIALSSIDSFVSTSEFECKLDKPINKVQLFDSIHTILAKAKALSSYIGSPEKNALSTSPSPTSESNRDARILVSEDIAYNRAMLVRMLEVLNYNNIDEAEDGQVTFAMLEKSHIEKNPYDVLLLDIRMPKMDGYDVVEAMKLRGWSLPRIVVVTASVLDDREGCAALGVEYYLNKPVDLNDLKNVMLRVTESL